MQASTIDEDDGDEKSPRLFDAADRNRPQNQPPKKQNTPKTKQIAEVFECRLDDTRSPPIPHGDTELEAEHARVAARALTSLTGEQRAAVRAAMRSYQRNASHSMALWREAGMRLAAATDGGAGGGLNHASEGGAGGRGLNPPDNDDDNSDENDETAGATAPSPAELLARLERAVNTSALHFSMLVTRFYSIVSSQQLAALQADCYPFCARPAVAAQAIDEEWPGVVGAVGAAAVGGAAEGQEDDVVGG